MAQEHLDRLTAVDASFLVQEKESSHMHIGGLIIAEGPAPAYDDLLDSIRARLHLVPRYRQKLATPPMETGRPLWVDDPNFFLEYHVRQTALPAPGDERQLTELAARIFSQRLDRDKPLWEMWLIEGLSGGRFALITKNHHALIDGISGVDLGQVLFDLGPVPTQLPTADLEAWSAHREPSPVQLVSAGIMGATRTGLKLADGFLRAVTTPRRAAASATEAIAGVADIAWATLNPAPETPLNVDIGPHRRYVTIRSDLRDFKEIKDGLGGTVNDVVLTVMTAALRRWLHSRGVRTEGLELRALVPVSIRGKNESGDLGNRLTVMRGGLPVYIDDPLERHRAVMSTMGDLKESKQAVGAEVLAGVQNFAPPTVLAQASRLNFSTRLFNLLVTNVPGPQFPLYV
ncbi:MAG: wax ester/triacylglycerol synthase family O-acyltransferase, partial [Solirubrobacteraceae bacterium]|nr:wax ester/triacylglycerol synthase family O-acyltransferase [Solirubrobacteraceae bacterium]